MNTKNKTLFKTTIGSHAWKMNRPDSDIDIFGCDILPTRDLLSGILRQNSHFTKGKDKDESRHEIGVVIEQLLKGNFNFVVGVCSPIVNEDKYGFLSQLRDITKRNLAKNIYHSTKGLAIHNYNKYILNKPSKTILFAERNISVEKTENKKILTPEEFQKKCNLIVRSLIFGEWILSSNNINFIKIEDQTIEDIHYWMKALDEAYKDSKLPETPKPNEFREFLYKLRIAELKGEIL